MSKRIYKNISQEELDYRIFVYGKVIVTIKSKGYVPVGVDPNDTSRGRYAYAESGYGVYCDELTDKLEYGDFFYSDEYFAPLQDTPSITYLEAMLDSYKEELKIRERLLKAKKERIDILKNFSISLHQYYELYKIIMHIC